MVDGKVIGVIGMVYLEFECKFGFNGCIIVFEIEWNVINICVILEVVVIFKFLVNCCDIVLVVDGNIVFGDIVEVCCVVGGELLKDVKLFDVYVGKGVEEGKKSLVIVLML